MKRIRVQPPKARRERPWPGVLPADPRDPEVVRAKALGRAARERRHPRDHAPADRPGPGTAGFPLHRGGRA
jgi:hypothetical protein